MTKQERLSAVFFLTIGVAVAYYGVTVLKLGSVKEPGPGFFPALCGAGIMILCLVWLVTSRISEADRPLWGPGEWVSPVLAVVIITAYAAGLEILGYITSTLLFLVLWQLVVEREKWKKTAIIALIGTAAMYALFSFLLGVPLPTGLLL